MHIFPETSTFENTRVTFHTENLTTVRFGRKVLPVRFTAVGRIDLPRGVKVGGMPTGVDPSDVHDRYVDCAVVITQVSFTHPVSAEQVVCDLPPGVASFILPTKELSRPRETTFSAERLENAEIFQPVRDLLVRQHTAATRWAGRFLSARKIFISGYRSVPPRVEEMSKKKSQRRDREEQKAKKMFRLRRKKRSRSRRYGYDPSDRGR